YYEFVATRLSSDGTVLEQINKNFEITERGELRHNVTNAGELVGEIRWGALPAEQEYRTLAVHFPNLHNWQPDMTVSFAYRPKGSEAAFVELADGPFNTTNINVASLLAGKYEFVARLYQAGTELETVQ